MHRIETLNVAGNRESKMSGIQELVTQLLVEALKSEVEPEDEWALADQEGVALAAEETESGTL